MIVTKPLAENQNEVPDGKVFCCRPAYVIIPVYLLVIRPSAFAVFFLDDC